MLILRKGNMWNDLKENTEVFVTTNSYIKDNGELAMGRGAAKQALQYEPDLAKLAGKLISENEGHLGWYRQYPPDVIGSKFIGVLQTKRHFKDKSTLGMIQSSMLYLAWYAELNPDKDIRVNFPGIGYGGLSRDSVLNILENILSRDFYGFSNLTNLSIWEYS